MRQQVMQMLTVLVLGASALWAADAGQFVMHHRQAGLWYSNNFGASAEDVFPEIGGKQEHVTVGHEGSDRSINIGRDDIDVLLGGRLREEGQMFDKPLTLRADYNDVYGFVRSKVNLDFRSQYGRRTYGKPAAQMFVRMTAFSIWDDATIYTPMLPEKVYFDRSNFLKKAEIDEHKHRGVVPLIYLDEGWVRVNCDAFLPALNQRTLAVQIGSFPFIVGRGVSLGSYFEGGVEAYGWERRGDIGNATQRPMGLLVSLGLTKELTLEAYYSKWRKRSHGPDWTREEVRAKRLDRDKSGDPRQLERGYGADSDVYAVRLGRDSAFGAKKEHQLYVEPYAVYMHAPELKVEFDADSSARYLTLGSMSEWTSGGWSVNCEVAVQVGSQRMHAIDRNHIIEADAYYSQAATTYGGLSEYSVVAGRLDKKIGRPQKYQSHIFLAATPGGGSPVEYLPYQAYYVSDEMKHINANRSVAEQGAVIRMAAPEKGETHKAGTIYKSQKYTSASTDFTNQSLYSQYRFKSGIDYYDTLFTLLDTAPDGTLYNANLPFGAQRRFRQGYTVSYTGVMGLLDIRYSLPNRRMNLSFAAGYIGGDKYPFTTAEQDKESSAFMPLRDADYVGRWVTSFVMLYPRKLPRPMDMSDNDLYAHNNYKTMQNLEYLGMGMQWYPKQDGSLLFEFNSMYFWEVAPPQKWDVGATRKFQRNSKPGKEDSIYQYIQDEQLHFKGAATAEQASKALGLELNVVARWRPYNSLQFDLRAGMFFPGFLYTQTAGCPNINTRRVDEKGEWHYDSLGDQTVTGAQVRVTYRF